jgi:hypothetical protein
LWFQALLPRESAAEAGAVQTLRDKVGFFYFENTPGILLHRILRPEYSFNHEPDRPQVNLADLDVS